MGSWVQPWVAVTTPLVTHGPLVAVRPTATTQSPARTSPGAPSTAGSIRMPGTRRSTRPVTASDARTDAACTWPGVIDAVTLPSGAAASTTAVVVRSSCGPTTIAEPRRSAPAAAVVAIAAIPGATFVAMAAASVETGIEVVRAAGRGSVSKAPTAASTSTVARAPIAPALTASAASRRQLRPVERGREGAPGGRGPGRAELRGMDPRTVERVRRGPAGLVVVAGPGHFRECTDDPPVRDRGLAARGRAAGTSLQ